RVVAEQHAVEVCAQQGVESVNVMAFAGDLFEMSDQTVRSADQMLAHAAKPASGAGTAADFAEAPQAALRGLSTHGEADVGRVRIDDEKGGWPAPASAQVTRHSLSSNGVSSTRRSAKFWRASWRGNSARIVGCVRNHSQYRLSDSKASNSC